MNAIGEKMPVVHPPATWNAFYRAAGALFLVALKARHYMRGYRRPRPFSIKDFDRAIAYDMNVVRNWMNAFHNYTGLASFVQGKSVLELGPGADQGVGLIMLMLGARRYNAIDVNNLVQYVPDGFYEALFHRLETASFERVRGVEELREQLDLTLKGNNDGLNYVWSKKFAISDSFSPGSIDVVFSQAAFEHFEAPERVIAELTAVAKSGAVFVAEIDLKTHSRWLCDADPLNIYRYSDKFYDLFKFPGSPNRVRPAEYREMLEGNGWHRVEIAPLAVLEDTYLSSVGSKLHERYRRDDSRMSYLSIMVCATKK